METFTEDPFEFRKVRIVCGNEGAGFGVMGVFVPDSFVAISATTHLF